MSVQTRRRLMVGGLTVAASLALVSACTSGAADGPGAQKTTDSTIPTFTFALGQMPTSLNGMSTKTDTTQVTSLVTEPLERVFLKDGEIKLTPHLASSAVERDATTVVYKLRKGVTFSNGKPLTPADVVWSFEAAAAPTAETAGNLSGFKSAKATGPDEVTITWKYPVIGLRAFLASVLIQEAAFGKAHPKELGTSAALPIGTGPYAYQRQTSQDITLVRNPEYWGHKPKPDKVTFTVISDASAGQLAMRSGSLQGARVTDPKTAAQWKGAGATLTEASNDDSNLLSMDTSKAPFDDMHVRKAVAASLDVKGVMAAAFGKYA